MVIPRTNMFSGKILLLWVISVLTSAKTLKKDLNDQSSVSTFLDRFINSYLRFFQSSEIFETIDDSPKTKFIRKKIAELRPYLQDGEESDNLTIEDNDDTIIIDFVPRANKVNVNNTKEDKTTQLKKNIKYYKKLRTKIVGVLEKESVTSETKNLVIKTIDKMISQLIGSQCIWKSSPLKNIERTNKFYKNLVNDDLEYIKSEITNFLHFFEIKDDNSNPNQFDEIINLITTASGTQNYTLKCQLVEERKEASKRKRNRNKEGDQSKRCEHFKVCSNELIQFMIDFDNALNDTTVSVLKNYAAMYARDVEDVKYEKDNVTSLIYKLESIVEKKIKKAFQKQLAKFTLDESKNPEANRIKIRNYVKNTIEHIKKRVKKCVEQVLKKLEEKLFTAVKNDIYVNLNVDLENLERDFLGRICYVFSSCKGKYRSQLHGSYGSRSKGPKNRVHVKLELDLDEDLKDVTKPKGSLSWFDRSRGNTVKSNSTNYNYRKNVNTRDNYHNVTVTRTMYVAETEKATTKFKNINMSVNNNEMLTTFNNSNAEEIQIINNVIW